MFVFPVGRKSRTHQKEDTAVEWKPSLDTGILDERMDNAVRRVSGSVGLDISFTRKR